MGKLPHVLPSTYLAIKRLAIEGASVKRLRIGELEMGRLHVKELIESEDETANTRKTTE